MAKLLNAVKRINNGRIFQLIKMAIYCTPRIISLCRNSQLCLKKLVLWISLCRKFERPVAGDQMKLPIFYMQWHGNARMRKERLIKSIDKIKYDYSTTCKVGNGAFSRSKHEN